MHLPPSEIVDLLHDWLEEAVNEPLETSRTALRTMLEARRRAEPPPSGVHPGPADESSVSAPRASAPSHAVPASNQFERRA